MVRYTVPSDLEQFWAAARFEIRSYLRTYRFFGLLALSGAISLILVVIFLYQAPTISSQGVPQSAAFDSAAMVFLPTILVLSTALLSGDALSVDFGSPAGYFSLVLPVRRTVLLLGRFLAAFMVALGIVLIYFLTVIALGAHYFGAVPDGFWSALGLVALYTASFVALGFLLSAAFRRPTTSLVVVVLLLYFAFPIVQFVISAVGVEPWFMLSYAGGGITQAFTPGAHITESGGGARGGGPIFHSYNPYLWEAAAIMAGYLVVGLGSSLAIFERRQVTG